MTWGRRLYFSSEEEMLRIIIALKNSIVLYRVEPANLGSIDKHGNCYTTEDDGVWVSSATVYNITKPLYLLNSTTLLSLPFMHCSAATSKKLYCKEQTVPVVTALMLQGVREGVERGPHHSWLLFLQCNEKLVRLC
jgi:hypothetical protein